MEKSWLDFAGPSGLRTRAGTRSCNKVFLIDHQRLTLTTLTSPKVHERDYISVSKIDHHSNKTVSWTTDPATLFADAGACILMVSGRASLALEENLRANLSLARCRPGSTL
jgi:hypothetical protein